MMKHCSVSIIGGQSLPIMIKQLHTDAMAGYDFGSWTVQLYGWNWLPSCAARWGLRAKSSFFGRLHFRGSRLSRFPMISPAKYLGINQYDAQSPFQTVDDSRWELAAPSITFIDRSAHTILAFSSASSIVYSLNHMPIALLALVVPLNHEVRNVGHERAPEAAWSAREINQLLVLRPLGF